jgi:cysteine synthase A
MQGWSPDFVATITESAFAGELVDRVVPVNGAEAFRLSRDLARQEGILTGITGGATLAGALAVAAEAPAGTNLLALLPHTGERYLSTPLFADVPADMDDEERAISRSTPGSRFDRPAPVPVPAVQPAAPAPVDAEAVRLLDDALAGGPEPVLMFGLEWCEFCWSLRRLFGALRIPFRAVDLDSVAWQAGGSGGRLRAALSARTGIATTPQVFVGGELVGGCTDVIDGPRGGDLAARLAALGVPVDPGAAPDPRSFLPGWIHPRT